MSDTQQKDKALFEKSMSALRAEIANAGAHVIIDATARKSYAKQVQKMSSELRALASTGKISWAQAAKQANETRNIIMEVIRTKSTPVGKAIAQSMKKKGKTLNELVAKKTMELHGTSANFNGLTPDQQNNVYAKVVESAGKSSKKVTYTMKKLTHAGRGLVFLSIALSVYNVATAQDKVDAAGKEVALTASGIGGGIAGGALAGLACGPGAPVCVTLGAFIGGGLAAFGISLIW